MSDGTGNENRTEGVPDETPRITDEPGCTLTHPHPSHPRIGSECSGRRYAICEHNHIGAHGDCPGRPVPVLRLVRALAGGGQ